MNLGMAVFTSFRGGHVNNFARPSLNDDVSTKYRYTSEPEKMIKIIKHTFFGERSTNQNQTRITMFTVNGPTCIG